MSWYVEYLILHRMEIKNSAESGAEIDGECFDDDGEITPMVVDSLQSDIYNDLLLVELEIKKLHERGVLKDNEIELLNILSWNPTANRLERETGVPSETYTSRFTTICNIISLHLGGIFTDKGYLDYMKSTYHLTSSQVAQLKRYIHSGIKHRIARRVFK